MNKLYVGFGVAALALIAMGAGGEKPGPDPSPKPDPKPDPKPEPKPEPDPPPQPKPFKADAAAEATGCAWALAERPEVYGELHRAPAQLQSIWLAVVAWRRAYPGSPVEPATADELAAFSRLASCVATGLKSEPDKPPVDQNPPLGGITVAERAAADAALIQRPTSVPLETVPAPMNERPNDANDARWFSNVAFWTVYRAPAATWMMTGHAPAPVTIDNKASVWAPVWTRINAYLAAKLVPKDPPKPGDKPPGGPITIDEKSAANVAVLSKINKVDGDVVPPPENQRKPGTTDATWFTNVTYWAIYRSPASAWILSGKAAAPVKIPGANSPWAAVWNRINAYVKSLVEKPAKLPPAGPLTAFEKSVADAAVFMKLKSVEASVVPPPDNERKPNATDADWYTNVAYWGAYRSPTSPWIQQGNAPAPVKIPGANSPWAAVWLRINKYVKTKV